MLRNRNAKFYNEEYSKYNIDDHIDAYQFFNSLYFLQVLSRPLIFSKRL